MGDRRSVGRLASRTFPLQVDPLSIVGDFRKLLNAFLGQQHPFGDADLAAYQLAQCLWRFEEHGGSSSDTGLGTADDGGAAAHF